ncbi:hypothetical protein D3C71_78860 [compost metagenome]
MSLLNRNCPERMAWQWKNPYLSHHRATLIQEITEYRHLVVSLLTRVLPDYSYLGVSEEDCFEWIVREEIELVFGLFDPGHIHNERPYSLIHNRVNAAAPVPLSRYTTHYLRAPALYGENNQVLIEVFHQDLWIDYGYDYPKYISTI